VVVDRKTGCFFKDLQDLFGLGNSFCRTFEKNQGIIGVLENRTGFTMNNRVMDCSSKEGMMQKPAEHISHDNEEIRRQGVTLAETVPAVNPTPWDSIEKNSSFARVEEFPDPTPPKLGEPTTL